MADDLKTQMTNAFGKLLAHSRKRKHLSLREVERITGIHYAGISRAEKGKQRPLFHHAVALCDLYKLPIAKLARTIR